MRERMLHGLANLVLRVPLPIVLGAIALAIAAGLFALAELRLNANTDDLVGRDRPYMQEYRAFLDEFGDLEYVYVVVAHGDDPEQAREAVDWLVPRLREIESLNEVNGFISAGDQLTLASWAMPVDALEEMVEARDAFPVLIRAESAGQIVREAEQRLERLVRAGMGMDAAERAALGASAFMLIDVLASADSRFDQPSLAQTLAPEYLVSDTGKLLFVEVLPKKDFSTLSVVEDSIAALRSALAEAAQRFPSLEFGLTGKPVLQADEMDTTNRDMRLAAVIALVLCALLFMLVIGGVVRPMLAIVAFLCAAGWTYGAATLFIGQLNLLSIVFMLVLVGVGLDYGIHVISRFNEMRTEHTVGESIHRTMLTAVQGNFTGALTSSVVFFMALFTTFQGLRELGIIAGTGLLLCLLAMTLVLPALLALVYRRGPEHEERPKEMTRASHALFGVFTFLGRHPRYLITGTLTITLALIILPGDLRFDRNLLELQARGLPSVQWEHRIVEDSASASWFGASVVETFEEVQDVVARAQAQPSIGRARSVLDLIPIPTAERSALQAQLAEVRASTTMDDGLPASAPAVNEDALRDLLGPLRRVARGAAHEAPEQAEAMQARIATIEAIAEALAEEGDAAEAMREAMNERVAQAGVTASFMVRGAAQPLRDALPEALRRQLMSPSGKLLVMMHPAGDVWEYEPMRDFIMQIQAVDPEVTGAPISHFESLDEMQASFVKMSLLSVLAVFALLVIDFRRIRDALLCMLPLGLGLLWTVELMGFFHLSFNLANFFALPVLIGLSVDSGVHLLHRYREGGPMRLHLGATRKAVILTSLTTIIGFGALLFAHHRGLQSLGAVMAIGTASCLLASVIVLPALLAVSERKRFTTEGH